jgi:hypothetical protein
MAPTYVCPKCSGTDVYFRNKQKITGLGGIYGNRQKEVKAPFCRKCDIEADPMPVGKDGKVLSGAELDRHRLKSNAIGGGCIGLVIVVIMLTIAVVAGLSTW